MKKTVLKNVTTAMILGLMLFMIILASCKKNDNSMTVQTPEGVQVKVPFLFEQNAVFVEGGKVQTVTVDDMDLFGLAIESTPLGQNNYEPYANGVFTDIPKDLELILYPGNNYRVFAFFYENTVDSVYDETITDFGFHDRANEILYGDRATLSDFSDLSLAKAGSAHYYRTVPHADLGQGSATYPRIRTVDPIINNYVASMDFQFETEFVDTLKFRQYNTRFEVQIANANGESRIVVGLSDFVTLPIASDTTFTLDMKKPADQEPAIKLFVDHDYFIEGENQVQQLYVNSVTLKRMETVRVEITAPDLDQDLPTSNSSQFVIIEEDFTPGDTIKVGG